MGKKKFHLVLFQSQLNIWWKGGDCQKSWIDPAVCHNQAETNSGAVGDTEVRHLPFVLIYQTLNILLGIQFRQRYIQIKDWRTNILLYFWLGMTLRLRGPGIYSRFVQSPLVIDLWMKECQILMIFSYFSWKWR